MNDANWPDDETRTEAMLPLLAEVFGTKGLNIDVRRIAEQTIRIIVPKALEAAASIHPDQKHKGALTAAAERCRKEGSDAASYAASYTARAASDAASAASYAARAASDAASAASYAASYTARAASDAARAASYTARAASDAASYTARVASYAARAASDAASYTARAASDAARIETYTLSMGIVIDEIKRARAEQKAA